MKSKRWTPVVAVAIIVTMALAPNASADQLVEFTTSSSGTRILTLNQAPTFLLTNDLTSSQNISTTTPGTVTVTEALENGMNPWSVKAQMCAPDDYANPTAGDCANEPNRMVRADNATGEDVLDGNDIAVAHGTPVKVLGGGTLTAGSEPDLGSQITLINNAGQNPLTVYTGTYTGTTNLSISNFTRTGTWKGMWVVTATI